MKKLLLGICFLVGMSYSSVFAQEIFAKVSVNGQKATNTDPRIFKSLERSITEFMNNRKWTNSEYESFEKIDCNIQLTITEESGNNHFKASLQIQSSRPVYNSNYSSVLLEHQDRDIVFDFQENDVFDFSDQIFTDNLTSILGFYGYLLLALDADSFAEFGGEDYFQAAMRILNNVPDNQVATYPGWRQTSSQQFNRFALINTWLNPRMKKLRSASYIYHIRGLDKLYESTAEGQKQLLEALKLVEKAYNDLPSNNMAIIGFFLAKDDEIVNVFSAADQTTRRMVYSISARADSQNSAKYNSLNK